MPDGAVQIKGDRAFKDNLVGAKGEGVGVRVGVGAGISRCKPVYREWINNKVLLSRIGS